MVTNILSTIYKDRNSKNSKAIKFGAVNSKIAYSTYYLPHVGSAKSQDPLFKQVSVFSPSILNPAKHVNVAIV